jgi:hypothetical protein
MLNTTYEPEFNDTISRQDWRKKCIKWDKKLSHIKEDEMLIYIRERVNWILEKRSQEYMKESM